MKAIIVCVTLACGVIGGAYGVTSTDKYEENKEKVVPTEYIDFEPLYIRAYANADLGDAY
mgnify:FL=1